MAYAADFDIPAGTTVSINNGTLSAGNLTNAGMLELTTGTISLTGDWSNTGTFVYGMGLVEFIGSAQNIDNTNTFYNLSSVNAGQALTFEAGETQTITNQLTLTGTAGNLISLRSSSPGTRWRINPQGGMSVSYVNVQDSNNLGATAIRAYNSIDSGNNINWLFGPTITGIVATDRKTSSAVYTNDRTISIEATGVSTAEQMIMAENASFSGASWQSYVNPTTFTIASASDGLKNIYYKIKDASSDESGTVEASITLDTTAPLVTVEAPNGGEKIKGNGEYTISWEATDNISLEVDPITIRFTSDEGTSWLLIASHEANDGGYLWATPAINSSQCRVSIEAIDRAQNVGTDQSNSSFIIDSLPPSAPTLEAPANLSTISSREPTMSWEASIDNLSGIASYEINLDGNLATRDATTSYSTSEPLADGTHTWEVRAKDGAGNWGDPSLSRSFTVETLTPEVSGITLRDKETGSSVYARNKSVSIEASGVGGKPIEMLISEEAGFTGSNWASYQNPVTFDLSITEGTKEVYYKFRNAASVESGTVNKSIILDTTEPSVPTQEAPANGSSIETSEATLSWEASTDNLSGIASYEIILDTLSSTQDATTYYTAASLLEGIHSWEVSAKDRAGNWGGHSTTWNFTVVTTTTTIGSSTTTVTSTTTTTSTTVLTVQVYIDDQLYAGNAINITDNSKAKVELLLNGKAVASNGIEAKWLDNRGLQPFYSNSNRQDYYTFPLPSLTEGSGSDYVLTVILSNDYSPPITMDVKLKRQEAAVKILSVPSVPLRGAILNIGFVARQAVTCRLNIFNVSTGVLVHSEDYPATVGVNNYQWKGALTADPGQYMVEINVPGSSDPPSYRYFFIGKFSN